MDGQPAALGSRRLLALGIPFVLMVGVAWPRAKATEQECGTTTEGHSTGEEEVCGEATDQGEATAATFAIFHRDAKLGQNSGVLCAVCPDDERCTRRRLPHGGATSTACEEKNGVFECTSCYTGAYRLKCLPCPSPPPEPPGGD